MRPPAWLLPPFGGTNVFCSVVAIRYLLANAAAKRMVAHAWQDQSLCP